MSCCVSFPTHHLVVVVQLEDHLGGVLGDGVGVAVDLHVVEEEGLVPGGVQRG